MYKDRSFDIAKIDPNEIIRSIINLSESDLNPLKKENWTIQSYNWPNPNKFECNKSVNIKYPNINYLNWCDLLINKKKSEFEAI
jgi:hypothetical protein